MLQNCITQTKTVCWWFAFWSVPKFTRNLQHFFSSYVSPCYHSWSSSSEWMWGCEHRPLIKTEARTWVKYIGPAVMLCNMLWFRSWSSPSPLSKLHCLQFCNQLILHDNEQEINEITSHVLVASPRPHPTQSEAGSLLTSGQQASRHCWHCPGQLAGLSQGRNMILMSKPSKICRRQYAIKSKLIFHRGDV